jgi:hypothetical protein
VGRTFGEIQFELTHFCRTANLPSVDLELLKGWINESYDKVLKLREWKGLETDATLQTVSTYRTGTVDVTNGSNAVTGTGTTFTSQMTGRKFRVLGRDEYYTFTYVSATSGTLDRNYEGDTVDDGTFEIFQNVYQLGARTRHIALMRNPRVNAPMERMTTEQMDAASASRFPIGEPAFYRPASDTDDSSTPIYHQVEIFPAPETAIGLFYTYIRLPIEFDGTNTDDEILPLVNPHALLAGAKALLLAHFGRYDAAAAEKAIQRGSTEAMHQAESDAVGPGRIRMADRFTRHRRARWSR